MEDIQYGNNTLPSFLTNCSKSAPYRCKYDLYVKRSKPCQRSMKEQIDEEARNPCESIFPFKYSPDVQKKRCMYSFYDKCMVPMSQGVQYYSTYKEYPNGGYKRS